METKEIRRDYNKIKGILPQSVIDKVLETATGDTEKYSKVHIIEHNPGWLYNAFVKILIPFSFRVDMLNNKQVSPGIGNFIYWFVLLLVMNIVVFNFPNECFTIIWLIVIVIALLPFLTAYYYLICNKNFYAKMGE